LKLGFFSAARAPICSRRSPSPAAAVVCGHVIHGVAPPPSVARFLHFGQQTMTATQQEDL
jgi:hypothetical protein